MSPYQSMMSLVQELQSGQRDKAAFLAGLDQLDSQLDVWAGMVGKLEAPTDRHEDMLDYSMDGLQLFADAVQDLRLYAESQDSTLLLKATDTARRGHELLAELMDIVKSQM